MAPRARDGRGIPHRCEDGGLRVPLAVRPGSQAAGQLEADVVMDLDEQGQEQLGVDAPHAAQAAVDGQELTQAAGCLGAERRLLGNLPPCLSFLAGVDGFSRRSNLDLCSTRAHPGEARLHPRTGPAPAPCSLGKPCTRAVTKSCLLDIDTPGKISMEGFRPISFEAES